MKKFVFITTTLLPTLTFATPQYHIIINANETNTRLQLFQYEPTTPLPTIKTIFTTEIPDELSTFADHPELAANSFKKILNNAQEKLAKEHIDEKTVTLTLYGIDKMRTLTNEKQQAIYNNISQFIKNNYAFNLSHIATLPGKTQGIYTWLSANYLNGNFNQFEQNNATLEISKQSTIITYATDDRSKPQDETDLEINHHHYIIFSKILSDIGLESTQRETDRSSFANACYPIDFPISSFSKGQFNMEHCKKLYAGVLQEPQIIEKFALWQNQNFIVTGEGFRSYEFLGVEDPDQLSYEARLNGVCESTWEEMTAEYDWLPQDKLSGYCANAVLVDEFVYQVLKLRSQQIWATDVIERQRVDWVVGAVLADGLDLKID